MSSNNVRPITITEGCLVFKFHPQFLRLSSQAHGYYNESKQKDQITLLVFCSFDSEVLRVCVVLLIESRKLHE